MPHLINYWLQQLYNVTKIRLVNSLFIAIYIISLVYLVSGF